MRWWVRDKLVISGLVVLVAALTWLFWSVHRLPSPRRADAINLGQFLLALVGFAITVIGTVRRQLARSPCRPPEVIAQLLANAVQDQWTRAAGERRLLAPSPIPVRWQRSTLPVAGPFPETDARFPPLPGLNLITKAQLQAGGRRELFAVYGGLGSGRLIITGAPGSGKSGAAVLLLLDALQHRERIAEADRPHVPVPVLFTLNGWDPSRQSLEAWLIARLVETYPPLFAGRNGTAEAAAVLAGGKLAIILDGLDEIAEDLRPTALRALSEQARCRVVLLTRSDEMVAAALKGHFVGAVALQMQDVDNVTGADYLIRTQLDPPPTPWRELIKHLHCDSASPVSQALNTPLMLTLVRDTYTSFDDVAELLDSNRFPSRDVVEEHLLDRVLPTAYAHRLGTSGPRYSLEQADRTLRYLARRMNQDGTRDLAWWRIPQWVPAMPRIVVAGLVAGLLTGLVLGLPSGVIGWLVVSRYFRTSDPEFVYGLLVMGPLVGLVVGFVLGFAFEGLRKRQPKGIKRVRWRSPVVVGLVSGSWGGLVFGLLGEFRLAVWSVLVLGLTGGLAGWLSQPESGPATSSVSDPLTSWRRDQHYGFVHGLVLGLLVWLTFALILGGLLADTTYAPGIGFVGGLLLGLAIWLTGGLATALIYPQTWALALACTLLRITYRMPWRMVRFLEDARSRHVLRTVGPVYQFRHARLQDRLGRTCLRSTAMQTAIP